MDVTAVNIGLSMDDFVRNLTESKLLTDEQIKELTSKNKDVLSLASSLTESGLLTDFQLDVINKGEQRDLRIGNYDILDKLGAGGMGTVYKARHRRMKRVVALKVLLAAISQDQGFIQRFQREVETIAKLGHPNIVMAYDADEAEAGHFLVMEFVDGKDLISFVEKNHPLSVPSAVDCIIQACKGLAFAHAQGIIHRDIKPANLLRDVNGTIKVTDLGLARMSNDKDEDHSLTQAGSIVGTVDYMAPEQAVDSTTIDHRADIYSLGGTLHYLLTGQPPYSGKTVMQVLLKHRDAPIPNLKEVRPEIPDELVTVFNRMMAKSLDKRYANLNDCVADLEKLPIQMLSVNSAMPLPKKQMAKQAESAQTMVSMRPSQIQQTNQLSKVFIVEPSRVQAGIIRKYLESSGMTVLGSCGTGKDAIAQLASQTPDAIVCSLNLDDMTGKELAYSLKKTNNSMAFVLISSQTEQNVSVSGVEQLAILPKPFSAEQLVDALKVATGLAKLQSTKNTKDKSQFKILIVDDSGAARANEKNILTALGYSNFTDAADGAQAIVVATKENFDLIVTDYNMPLMDGLALVSYLKQTPSSANIPIVMVTTETSNEILDPIRKLGVLAIFTKAFPREEVKQFMEKQFGHE